MRHCTALTQVARSDSALAAGAQYVANIPRREVDIDLLFISQG